MGGRETEEKKGQQSIERRRGRAVHRATEEGLVFFVSAAWGRELRSLRPFRWHGVESSSHDFYFGGMGSRVLVVAFISAAWVRELRS